MSTPEYEETVRGIVESVVFQNQTNGFTVIEINSEGNILTAVGMISEVAAGEEVELHGKWDSHATFGRQFRFSSCSRTLPDTAAKLFRYLASGAIKGVGPKLAAKIIREFGDRAFEVLENEPDRLAVINGISKKKAVDISNEFNRQYAMRKIMLELESYGITPTESTNIYKYFGVTALEVIRKNPYVLCGTVRGFNFERVEKLRTDMDLTPDSTFRNTAGILYIVTYNLYQNGHTCIPSNKIIPLACDYLEIGEEEALDTVTLLAEQKRLYRVTLQDEEYLFLPDIYEAERRIAERLKRAVKFTPSSNKDIKKDICELEEQNGIQYAEKQKEAIRIASQKGLLILTGGPGTGKTTTVRGIIEILERRHIDILLCAPTGMAAKRMAEVTGREAKTIHRLLEVEWTEEDKPVFRRDAQNPLQADAIIIDEVSMVDVELMASLLDAVPIGCRIILVGDADQLPSVGPGNVLSDVIGSGVLPVVCLNEIFRQAQKSLIVSNAHKIIHGEMPELGRTDNDFFFMKRANQFLTGKTVTELISQRLPEAYGFDPIADIQVLCPAKRGECGTGNTNKRLQQVLNPPDRSKSELKTPSGRVFREGDRVMQLRNNYNIHWKKDLEEGDGIFNGDIGIIQKINFVTDVMYILFDDRVAEYPSDMLSDLELAYAVTVHKSQGSEYPVVILPLIDCPPVMMYRNLLYTAVTRAKKMLIIVGDEQRVRRMTENNKTKRRYSALKSFLTE